MSLALAPTLTLQPGVPMPQLGLGTWPMNDEQAAQTVAHALQMGYRLVDTAENYGNETGVGEGLRRSGVARDQVFVTTKFNRQWHSLAGVRTACCASLQRLGLDYVDMLLIHWPNPDQDRYVEAFQGMLELQREGLVRVVGTSNFKPTHLQRLFDLGLSPALNQIQIDPYHQRDAWIACHRQHGVVTQTWRPLGLGTMLLQEAIVSEIAARLHKTPAQIVLRWNIQQGFATATKSSDPARMAQNLAVFDFELANEDMVRLTSLQRETPDSLDSDRFGH